MTSHGIVAAGHALTAAAAAEILADGGNAFDAAIAGVWMSCVAEPALASPGGGGFLMARGQDWEPARLYDFFADTPRSKRPEAEIDFHAIHADFGPAQQEFHIGLGSAATPGVVPGLFAVHEDLGRLPMRRLVEPAVRAARAGFPLSTFQATLFNVIASILTATPAARAVFAPSGTLLRVGESFANPQLADTLEWLAEDGPRLFSEGDVAAAVARASHEGGGHLTAEDLSRYGVERRAALIYRYRRAVLALNPAPAASGPLIAFGLGLLQVWPKDDPLSQIERLLQVLRLTNDVRARYADGLAARIESGALLAEFATLLRHPAMGRGTTHLSVIDAAGNAAGVTLSNGEGNGHMVGGFGFMLNNMLGEEDLAPRGFHAWPPGIRLSSMMAPTIIVERDGRVTALGSGGSNRIRSAILEVTLNLLDRGMDLQEAVDAPRLHVEKCGTVSFEPGFSERDEARILEAAPDAHVWPQKNLFFGGVHLVRRDAKGWLEGAGDPRREGVVALA